MEERSYLNHQLILNQAEKTEVAGCYKIERILANKSEIDLYQLNYELYDFFVKFCNEFNFSNQITEKIIRVIKFKRYFIFRDLICLMNDNLNDTLFLKFIPDKFYIFTLDLHEFKRIFNLSLELEQIIIIDDESSSNCRNNADRFKCLDRCIKVHGQRLSKYFFDANESGVVLFKYDKMKYTDIAKVEKYCIMACKNEKNCKKVYFIASSSTKIFSKRIQFFYVMSKFNFIGQLFSLIFLFLNTSLYNSLKILLTLPIKFIKNNALLFKVIILSFNLLLISGVYLHLIQNYIYKRDNPIVKEITFSVSKAEPVNLVLCISIPEMLNISEDTLNKQNKTYLQIEEKIKNTFKRHLVLIYFEFQDKKFEVFWRPKSRVFFRKLRICWQVEVTPMLYGKKLKNLYLPLFKLVIECTHYDVKIFLLPNGQSFHTASFKFQKTKSFIKLINRRSKLNRKTKCVDYKEKYAFCDCRKKCLDECFQKKLYEKFNATFLYDVLDKHHVIYRWSNLVFSPKNIRNLLNIPVYRKLLNECSNELPHPDCTKIRFKSVQMDSIPTYTNKTEIVLAYDIISSIEEEESILKLLLNILNYQIVIFNINAFTLIKQILRKLTHRKTITYLLCTIAFFYYIWFIFDEIITGTFIYNQKNTRLEKLTVSRLVFCGQSEQRIDDVFSSFFDKIAYLDEQNEWITIDNRASFLEQKRMHISTFDYAMHKCVIIKHELKYYWNQFQFRKNFNVLKIYFNKTLIASNTTIYFMSKSRKGLQFSKILSLRFRDDKLRMAHSVRVSQEYFDIIYNDRFSFLRNPFSLFPVTKTADHYISKLLEYFERCSFNHNYLKKEIFDPKIEYEFEQFFKLILNKTLYEKKLDDNRKRFFINYLSLDYHQHNDKANFIFAPIFFKRIIEITNEQSWSLLILNLLNSLSFFFDLGILDMQFYIFKVLNFICNKFAYIKIRLFDLVM